MSDKEFDEEIGKILDNHYSKQLLPFCSYPGEIIEFLKKSLTTEKCSNSECYFEHEGYCSLEKIDLLDEEVDLNISFACPKIKIEEMIEHEN